MKKLIGVLAVFFIFALACGTRSAAGSDGKPGTENAKRDRELYQEQARAKLHELDQQIDVLEDKVRRASEAERKRLAPQITDLDHQREVAHQKLKQLGTESQAAWADMKVGMDKALHDLDAAYQQANSHFR